MVFQTSLSGHPKGINEDVYIYICFEEFQLRKGSLLEMIITIKYI